MKLMLTLLGSLFVSFFVPFTSLHAAGPMVTTDSGTLEGTDDNGVRSFKGIPYAAPPVGELRWRAPQPVAKWSGVRKTTDYGNDAPQKNAWAANQDEDCLYLNVWAPARGVGFQPAESERTRQAGSPSHLAPVMVWIHGGGFINGSGRIHGETFAKRGVVLVSFNYRLGRLGFFAHPALDQQRPADEPPANFWLQDQIAALKWIQRNIARFGGDPDCVTIFGVSAGGTSVNMLMASLLAKGLFQRAIAQSGIGGFGPYRRWNVEHSGRKPLTKIGEHFATAQGLEGKPNVAAALRALPWKTVAKIGSGIEDREGFDIVVDGVTLTDDPQQIFEQGRQNPVPFIGGFNSFEGSLSLVLPWTDQPPRAEVEARLHRLAPLYDKRADDKTVWNDLYGDVFFGASTLLLVREMERTSTPAWTYYFDYVRGRGRNSRGAGHGSEVPFVFGSVLLPGDRDREIIHAMQGHWIQFAKAGDPNGPGLPAWPAYASAQPMTLVYGQDSVRAEREWHKARFDLLFEAIAATWPRGTGFQPVPASPSTIAPGATPKINLPEAASTTLTANSEKALRDRVAALKPQPTTPPPKPNEAPMPPAATAMERHPDIRYREMPGVDAEFHTLDVYSPKGAKSAAVMFFIHGGGLTGGSKEPGKNFPQYCARMGMVLVTINYRLSPAVKHPAHIQDCAAAFRWTYDNIRKFGGDPARIFVAGHSSGAQLANLLCTDGKRLADEGLSLANIKGAIIFDTAAHDMTTGRIDAGSIYEKAFGTDPAVLKDGSPVLHVAPGRRIPPHLFLGAKPPLMPMEAKVRTLAGYAQQYRDAGVRCEVAVAYFRQHITIITAFGPPEEPVTAEVTRFIQSILNDEPASPPLGGPVKELQLPGVRPADIQRENDIKSARTLLKSLDKNNDAKVSRAEAEARGGGHWLNWFPLLDKNQDGFVTVEEQTAAPITRP